MPRGLVLLLVVAAYDRADQRHAGALFPAAPDICSATVGTTDRVSGAPLSFSVAPFRFAQDYGFETTAAIIAPESRCFTHGLSPLVRQTPPTDLRPPVPVKAWRRRRAPSCRYA